MDSVVSYDFFFYVQVLLILLCLKRFPDILLSCRSLDPQWWAETLEGGVEKPHQTGEAVFEEACRGQQRGVSE